MSHLSSTEQLLGSPCDPAMHQCVVPVLILLVVVGGGEGGEVDKCLEAFDS